jgi:NADH:ubiquinone reductase (H+-translocating)
MNRAVISSYRRSSKHVLIIGAGFAGLAAARALGNRNVRVTIIDKQNYHLFAPLLYQVATAALSPADIAEPIRRVLAKYKNIEVVLGEVVTVDRSARLTHLAGGEIIGYDYLIVATGSLPTHFGNDAWAKFAPPLKSIDDAREIRTRVLTAFERAERTSESCDVERWMTFIVVGGGPTGVELAGSIAELARHTLSNDFRRISSRCARVILIEAGPRILSSFPPDLSDYAEAALGRLGVQILTDSPIVSVDGGGVIAGDQHIASRTVLWGAGVKPSPAAKMLQATTDRGGRVVVNDDLRLPTDERIFVLGDVAAAFDTKGRPLPGLAQVAQQQGRHVGRNLLRLFAGNGAIEPFVFKDRGNAAIVGRHAAVFDFGKRRLRGYKAWLLWAIVHIALLVNFDQRVRVSAHWAWRYLTYKRGARLITSEAKTLAGDVDCERSKLR